MQKRGPPRPFNNQLIAKGGLSTQDVRPEFASLYADNLELNESLFAGPGLDTPAHRWQEAAPVAWRRSCAPVVSGNWPFVVVPGCQRHTTNLSVHLGCLKAV